MLLRLSRARSHLMGPQAATELTSTSGSVDLGRRRVRGRAADDKWGCSLTISFFLFTGPRSHMRSGFKKAHGNRRIGETWRSSRQRP